MRKKKSQAVGDVLRQFMREEGLESPLNEFRLIEAWKEITAPIAAYTGNVYIRNQTLHVHLTSPALRQNLMMKRAAIVQRLNEQVGAQVVVDVAFH